MANSTQTTESNNSQNGSEEQKACFEGRINSTERVFQLGHVFVEEYAD